MLPIIPLLLVSGGVFGGLDAAEKRQVKRKFVGKLEKLDKHYQSFVKQHVDPLFGSKNRNTQIGEFAEGVHSEQEANINRGLAISAVTTGAGIVGSLVYPPLSLISAAGVLYVMSPLLYNDFKVLMREKRIKYRLVAGLSVIAGLASGFYVVMGLMTTFVFTAFKISARTEAYSKATLVEAFTLQTPQKVWLLVDGQELEVPFEQVQVGDCVVLNAGQVVPIDGEVILGAALVDQHALTGESQPSEKSLGDEVFANTIVLSGQLHVRVAHTGNATTAAQISKILRDAAQYQLHHEARSEQLADKLAIPMLAASGLALASVSTEGAVAILNSGLGSTMYFAGPLSMLTYLNLASHKGILVKDGRSLETLREIDTIVFDKTGTLTLEQPEVCAIHCCANWTVPTVLRYAAMAEQRQTHPIAKAILIAAEQHQVQYDSADIEASAYEIGFGIRLDYQGQTILVGSQRFITQQGIMVPDVIEQALIRSQRIGNALVMVAVAGQLIGALELQSQLRPETEVLIERLHKRGLKLAILSGDTQAATEHLAKRLHIESYFAEVLPETKADTIKQLQQTGRKVCFVGDGINDAIALKQADVSVSLRGATTLATDSAQIVLVSQSLLTLDQLLTLAQEFNRNLDRTMTLSYIPSGILITGVFFLGFGMPAALVLYTGGLTAAMLNATLPLLQLTKEEA